MELYAVRGSHEYVLVDETKCFLLKAQEMVLVSSKILLHTTVSLVAIPVYGVVVLDFQAACIEVGVSSGGVFSKRVIDRNVLDTIRNQCLRASVKSVVIVGKEGYSLSYYFIPSHTTVWLGQ